MSESCFRLKGSVVTVVVLELHDYSPDAFAQQLSTKIEQVPQLLHDSPLVFTLDKFAGEPDAIDFSALARQCRELGVQPLGVRDCPPFNAAVKAAGLAVLPATGGRESTVTREPVGPVNAVEEAATRSAAAPSPPATPRPGTRLITSPVRSGQQIYARDSDLIIMSQVSEGAEVLADGNIHIYGGLRGRALAGVRGDHGARIFCHSLDAELISIAGHFLLSEDVPQQHWKKPAQVFLEEETLQVDALT